MTIQLIFGIMNPLAMVAVAIVITAEKTVPRPNVAARLVGITTVIAGIVMTIHWLVLNYL